VKDGYYVWVFDERAWFAGHELANQYARRAAGYCPKEFIDVQEVATGHSIPWV
jgi:hypothetical protein